MIISSSEVATWDACGKKHFYAHELKLAPKQQKDALLRGNVIHEGLAEFYRYIKEFGWLHREDARKAAMNYVTKQLIGNLPQAEIIAQCSDILTGYFDYWTADNFRVVEVEEYHEVPIGDNLFFGMRLDMLIEMMSGQFRGQLIVVDHKSTFNFWSAIQKDLNSQLPKYQWALNKLGIPVRQIMVNQLRTRQLKSGNPEDHFKRIYLRYKPQEIERIAQEHVMAAQDIAQRRMLPVSIRENKARRTMGPDTCNKCDFTDLCKFDLQGLKVDATIAANFRKNPYGY